METQITGITLSEHTQTHTNTGKSQTNPEGSYAIRDNTSPVMDHNGGQKFASRPVRRQDKVRTNRQFKKKLK